MNAQDNILNNRYQLLSQHGSGGMSVIYRAADLALGRQVAVKILRPSLTSDPNFLERFRQEARNVANLQHPNIVTVHDVGQDGNTHYIVMELIEGDDLKKLIRAEAPLSIERALDVAIKICAGIGYAHRAGLVHADVKPQNILMVGNDNLKVTDFGIAQALAMAKPGERQKIVWGSPHYFSPEQATGKYPTPASDVYSIGIVLFEMLTGRLPFIGNDQQELAKAHIRQQPPHLMDFNAQIPESLDRIVQKVLAKEPDARYRMADQLGRILQNYREQGTSKTAGQPIVPVQITPPSAAPTISSPIPPQDARFAPPSPTAATLQTPIVHHASTAATLPGRSEFIQQGTTPNQVTRPELMRDTGYYSPVDPPQLDVVTLLLGFIAFLAVTGMVILWFFVFQAYYG